jgi:hypothetical protein
MPLYFPPKPQICLDELAFPLSSSLCCLSKIGTCIIVNAVTRRETVNAIKSWIFVHQYAIFCSATSVPLWRGERESAPQLLRRVLKGSMVLYRGPFAVRADLTNRRGLCCVYLSEFGIGVSIYCNWVFSTAKSGETAR